MMKSPFRFLGVISLGVAGLTAAYLLGKGSGDRWGHEKPHGVGAGSAGLAQINGSSQVHLPEATSGDTVYRRDQRLYAYAERLSLEDLPAALSEALHLPLSQRNRALGILLGRWSELDPAGATNYTMVLPSSAQPYQLREAALASWAKNDFDAALAWTLKQDRGYISDCLATLASSIAEAEPKQAIEFVKAHAKGSELTVAYQRVYAIWAERDYEGALASAQSMEPPPLRKILLFSVLETRAEKDPRVVLETMESIKDRDLLNSLERRAMEAWTKRDLTSAQEWALTQADGDLRADAIYRCVTVSVRNDVESTLNWVSDRLQGVERESALRAIFMYTGSIDSAAALKRAQALADPSERNYAISAIAASIAETDRPRALELVQELPEGEIRGQTITTVCRAWAEREPQGAAQWLADHLSEADAPNALSYVVSRWRGSDATAALTWLQSLPSSSRKNELIASSFVEFARGNIDDAQAAFAGLELDSQRAASHELAVQWARRNPEAALEWAAGLSDDDTRANAIKGAMEVWGFDHREDAAKWLTGLPAGPDRDAGTQIFAATLVWKDPPGAIEWASSIGDELRRENAIRQVMTSWIRKDKAAASAWLTNDTALPDSLRGELQRTAAVAQ